MEKNTKHKVKLGFFVALGLFIFIVGIYFIGREQNLFGNNFKVKAVFRSVDGLQTGGAVRFAGINVGTVDVMEIVNDTTVRVEMVVSKNVKQFIKKDSKAEVASDGLMGNKLINIVEGSPNSPQIHEGDMIASIKPVSTDDILKSLKKTTDNAAGITDDLQGIFKKVNNGEGTIGTLINDKVLADNLKTTIANVKDGSSKITATATKLTTSANQITTDVKDITGQIKSGKGALGMVLYDSSFQNDLRKTVANVKSGAQGFSDNMEALKHSFLLRKAYKREDKEKLKKAVDDIDTSGEK
jgi:phospholipid/cholesterol/gamma-HCH transport system substrate-binding protein